MDAIGRLVRDGIAVGTAFIVSADGIAATAEHVIGSRRDASWTFEPLAAPGLSLPVDAAMPTDAAADVALVRIAEAGDWQPMTLASHANVLPGDPVHLRGFAQSFDYDSGVGEYVGETGEHGRVWVKVSCRHAQPGMSGAPVLLTGTGCVIGLVSARLNVGRWNRDTMLLARTEDIVALAPGRLRLTEPVRRHLGGTLRLSWDRGNTTDLILETDDFHVSLGRNSANLIYLKDDRDSRFHGKLSLVGPSLVYQQLGSHPTFLVSATRQIKIGTGVSCPIGDKDRLRFASGVILVEFSAPDLYDPKAGSTATADGEDTEGGD
ncbi:MAG: trypsin-like peptidase domain-containing protein [Pseudonocardiaceae bacterium]